MPNFESHATVPAVDVVVLCSQRVATEWWKPLHAIARVATARSPDLAVQYIARAKPPLMIVDGDRADAASACDTVRSTFIERPSLLVTPSEPHAAGQLIDKCDSILMKPFAPSLLVGRVGHLIRLHQRAQQARQRSARLIEQSTDFRAKSDHLRARAPQTGTLIEWPNDRCPHCGKAPVIMFDYAGSRRAWYACPTCRKVWIARQLGSRRAKLSSPRPHSVD